MAKKKRVRTDMGGKDPSSDKDIDDFAAEVVGAAEEINAVSREKASLEDIEGAKAMTGMILDKYADLMKRLDPDRKKKLERNIGPGIEQIKNGLHLLKEAPE
ncbi:MAG TPA: hypothetical protein VLB09_09130 [Nitrospiria bacterium]|nr:hypothetical protein [Nitrospiria bacterium]